MTAWTTLIANSTLQTGTAWQHLQNQQGGGGPAQVTFVDNIDVEVEDMLFEAELEADIEVELEADIVADIDDQEIEAEIE